MYSRKGCGTEGTPPSDEGLLFRTLVKDGELPELENRHITVVVDKGLCTTGWTQRVCGAVCHARASVVDVTMRRFFGTQVEQQHVRADSMLKKGSCWTDCAI